MTGAITPVSTQREPELAGQTVVLIGGSAVSVSRRARRARAEGADVILTGRNPGRLEQAALELGAAHTAAFDANDAASLKRFFEELPAPIDHVMVTAGGPHSRYGPCSRWTQPRCARRSATMWCWRSRLRATPSAR